MNCSVRVLPFEIWTINDKLIQISRLFLTTKAERVYSGNYGNYGNYRYYGYVGYSYCLKNIIMDGKKLESLAVYKQAVEISTMAWEIFIKLPNRFQYHIGNQFLDSIDSIGANIAEGFGRFHYKDSIKFYYNSRGSLFEAKHWAYLLKARNLIAKESFDILMDCLNKEGVILNKFINSIKEIAGTPSSE
jgi:four helix bundle protein